MKIGDFIVPGFKTGDAGFNGRVSAIVSSPADDLSGNTDSTDLAEKGIKPKKLNVSFSLQHQYRAAFIKLAEMCEAKDTSGAAIRYNIIHPLAQVLRVRSASFMGEMNIDQDDVLKCWHIRFTLVEYRSVPEITDQRANAQTMDKGNLGSFEALVKRLEYASL